MDERTTEQDTELHALTTTAQKLEVEYRAAMVAEEAVEVHATTTLDTQARERVRLRDRCTLGGYILARLQGRLPAAEHAEYMDACGVESGIPIDLFESDRPAVETHADAPTPAPAAGSGAALSIGGILPHIFDLTIARLLGISMPVVGTGTHSELVVTTPPGTAAAKAKGSAIESTAGALTPVFPRTHAGSPRRLTLQAEDAAQIGTPRFEAAMRAALMGSLSDGYDVQCLPGRRRSRPTCTGLMAQLDTPTAPTDGGHVRWHATRRRRRSAGSKYAETLRAVSIIVPSDVYRLSVSLFRDAGENHRGSVSAQRYLSEVLGGWSTATRLPVAPSTGDAANVSTGIVRRTGRGMQGAAIHPTWNSIAIDDIYSDSASATRHVSLHVLVGDKVLLVRPKSEVYDLVSYKVA